MLSPKRGVSLKHSFQNRSVRLRYDGKFQQNFVNYRSKSTLAEPVASHSPKPFSEIPGPPTLPVIGNFHQFFSRGFENFMESVYEFHEQYGDIIKFRVGPVPFTVSVRRPDLIEQVFQATGKYPIRIPIPVTKQYAEDFKLIPPLADAQGEEWSFQRKSISRAYLFPQTTDGYIPPLNQVGKTLLECIESEVKDQPDRVHPDVHSLCQRFSFEAVGTVFFGKSLGALKNPIDPLTKEFIDVAVEALTTIGHSATGFPIHKYFPLKYLPHYRRFVKVMTRGRDLAEQFDKIMKREENSLGSQLLKLDAKQVAKEALPTTLLAGVDTTQTSIQWILYGLSKNPQVQEKLYQEIVAISPHGQPISAEQLRKMTYLKNTVMEGFRLHTPVGTNVRILPHEFVLEGYKIPADTQYFLFNLGATRDKRTFGDPENFRPERWTEKKISGFANLPFGQGSRSCLGQRIALAELEMAVAYITRAYKLQSHSPPLKAVQRVLLEPHKNPKIAFIPRTN